MREYIVALARKLIGTPYIWAGQTPWGFDCSGFVIWILQVFGVLPSGDWTADSLSKRFERMKPMEYTPRFGDLVCYGTKQRITHIAIYSGAGNQIAATGGGSDTTSLEVAKLRNAMVKEKPVNYRKDLVCYCNIEAPVCNK